MLDEEEGGVGVFILICSCSSTLSDSRGIRPAAANPLNILAFENAWAWISV